MVQLDGHVGKTACFPHFSHLLLSPTADITQLPQVPALILLSSPMKFKLLIISDSAIFWSMVCILLHLQCILERNGASFQRSAGTYSSPWMNLCNLMQSICVWTVRRITVGVCVKWLFFTAIICCFGESLLNSGQAAWILLFSTDYGAKEK